MTRIRLLAALLILAAVSIFIGCRAATQSPSPPPTPTPDFVVRLWGGVPGTPNLLSIFGEAGVVTDARVPEDEPKDLHADISATPLTEVSLLVEWSGFICESRPSLTVDRADDRLTLFLEHGPVPDSCAAMAVPYSVLLMVDPSLDLDGIEIEVAESRPQSQSWSRRVARLELGASASRRVQGVATLDSHRVHGLHPVAPSMFLVAVNVAVKPPSDGS